MSKRQRREIPIIDLSMRDVVIDGRDFISTIPDDLMKAITKRLSLSDLTRLGLTSKNMKRLTSVEIANIMDDPLLQKLAQRYKSRLMRPIDRIDYYDKPILQPFDFKDAWFYEYLKERYVGRGERMYDQLGRRIDHW